MVKIETILGAIAKEYNLKKKMMYIYGDLNGYTVKINEDLENYASKLIVCYTIKMGDVEKEAIKKALEDLDEENQKKKILSSEMEPVNLFKKYSLEKYYILDDSVQFKFISTTPKFKEKFFEFVTWFTNVLSETGIKKHVCPICGMEIENDKDWFLVDYKVYHAHEKCINYMNEKNENDNSVIEKEDQGSYLTGIIGAILGSIIGSLIYIWLGVNGYWTFYVTPFMSGLAVFLYNKFNGRRSKNKKYILGSVVFIMVILADIARVVIIVANEINKYMGQNMPINYILDVAINFIIDREYKYMIPYILLGEVFAVISLIGALKSDITNIKKLKIKKLS